MSIWASVQVVAEDPRHNRLEDQELIRDECGWAMLSLLLHLSTSARGWSRLFVSLQDSSRAAERVQSFPSSMTRSLFVGLLLALGSCTLVKTHEDSQAFYAATVLAGRVTAPQEWWGPVIVAATKQIDDDIVLAHHVLLHEPGGYELIVPDGSYTLLAFGDGNRNGAPDPDEPAAVLGSKVEVAGSGLLILLDLTLAPHSGNTARQALPRRLPVAPTHSTQAGAIAELDAPAFSAQAGRDAYWAPLESFRRTGGNIYFMEPYDRARTPVLFVHGAAGSAQDWRTFCDRLDRSRYQAWIFQYPSGAPVDSMAHLLFWKLLNLQLRYGFDRIDLVAHSMGGLVVRRFLLDHAEKFPQLGTFVSLSTPWGGESTATLGVQYSPAVVPSWRDMQPDGPFLSSLFERPLPRNVPHALLFGHRGGYSLVRPNNDGSVTLASQLRPEAQAQAMLVQGFDEDHVSILAAPRVTDYVFRLLDAVERPDLTQAGQVQLSLSFDGAPPADSQRGLLMLTPEGEEGSPPRLLAFALAGDSATAVQSLGPITAGTYQVRLLAAVFNAEPGVQKVSITRNGTSPLSFNLRPRGVLAGYVAAEVDSAAHPAGSYRASGASLNIQRVVLEGPAGARELMPQGEEDSDVAFAARLERDEIAGSLFTFLNLPDGEHTVTVYAEGYEPHVSQHRVTPGSWAPAAPIVLRKKVME